VERRASGVGKEQGAGGNLEYPEGGCGEALAIAILEELVAGAGR
jgi:hypothetical protein